MLTAKIFITNAINIDAFSFYPRNYDPVYLFVKEKLNYCPYLGEIISQPVKGGSTPPSHLFHNSSNCGIPFVKTSAVSRHFINTNDLYFIDEEFHNNTIKRSITKPYDVIYTMTGKFMGKAALCPPTIPELNISQNSVVIKTDSPLKSAFITIFLNSKINRIQVKGVYSITKQKFMNQSKISKLKVIPYNLKYNSLLEDYINAIDDYYYALDGIKKIVSQFSHTANLKENFNKEKYSFNIQANFIDNRLLLPNYYRTDIAQTILDFDSPDNYYLEKSRISKGDEVGSSNYLDEGLPFIKTSDIINYDVDYEPDCYCSESFINQLSQGIKKGDIIFTKDGKPGEIAIIQEDANVIIASGLVKYRPSSKNELYWLFLLLSSTYGKAYFTKWFVIASTMAHLRKDFFNDFRIPVISDKIRDNYLNELKKLFDLKEKSFIKINNVKSNVLSAYAK